jgi:hypothetical protein
VPLNSVPLNYASMDQGPRKPEEEERFKRALKSSMNVLYGSACTTVLMLTSVAAWSDRKYDVSGWCNTEKAISSVIKPAKALQDLGHAIDQFEARKVARKIVPTLCMHAAFRASGQTAAKQVAYMASRRGEI